MKLKDSSNCNDKDKTQLDGAMLKQWRVNSLSPVAPLQELRTRPVICSPRVKGHVGLSLTAVGHNYAARIGKLILSGAMCQIPFRIRNPYKALSQLVQYSLLGLLSCFLHSLRDVLESYLTNCHISFSLNIYCCHHFTLPDPSLS
ncbi:hypothetical protein PoB_002452500 [Plakobranchus ocellatus]|uniref:Uncharacterized protein n=1 Tax=Plakobranchus ocellatus TaxID=259542 RepID=A0AAV3ZTQ6_9GAST|nr:hypothetical protein PoB_002452500 [Plakobranchus ocellatus]